MPAKKKIIIPKFLYPTIVISFLLNIFFLVKPYFLQLATNNSQLTTGHAHRIIDGDTFDLTNDQRIRLAGADAPEFPRGCLAKKAKYRLQELVMGKKVTLEPVAKDNFNRQISYVFIDDLLIDQVIVEEGLAKAEENNPKYDPKILTAQEKAQKLKKGIWSEKCQPKKDCLIKGNVSEQRLTKIYHLPDCYNYAKVVIKEEEGDAWFCTEQEAQNAGFVKSKDCP